TSGASTKRRPSGVSKTIPSKICSRGLSSASTTVPRTSPPEARTGTPAARTLYEIAWPSSGSSATDRDERPDRRGRERDGDADRGAALALRLGEAGTAQADERDDDGPQREQPARDEVGRLGRLALRGREDGSERVHLCEPNPPEGRRARAIRWM